ncbi:hypothetical protein C0J52_08935 [Blattella germanica]|nr:hypothetical protein C0J52_08935 [Blattella germanica]
MHKVVSHLDQVAGNTHENGLSTDYSIDFQLCTCAHSTSTPYSSMFAARGVVEKHSPVI